MCEYLTNVCHKDLNYGALLNERNHLKLYIVLDDKCGTLPELYGRLLSSNLKYVAPDVELIIRGFLRVVITLPYRGALILKTQTSKETVSQRNEPAGFELSFPRMHGKCHPEDL